MWLFNELSKNDKLLSESVKNSTVEIASIEKLSKRLKSFEQQKSQQPIKPNMNTPLSDDTTHKLQEELASSQENISQLNAKLELLKIALEEQKKKLSESINHQAKNAQKYTVGEGIASTEANGNSQALSGMVDLPDQKPALLTQQGIEEQARVEANQIQFLEEYVKGTPDYAGESTLKNKFQTALAAKFTQGKTPPITLNAVNCSLGFCKLSISKNNLDSQNTTQDAQQSLESHLNDPLLVLFDTGVIPDEVEFLTVPTDNGIDVYLSQSGEPFPESAQ